MMLKYKRKNVTGCVAAIETLVSMISGSSGKNRRVISIGTEYKATCPTDYLRVYRDADQIVDCDLSKLWNENRWLPMDIPLAEGQECLVGVYGEVLAADHDIEITIGYEETG